MSRLIDLFSGMLFSFKSAQGADVNAGTSDKVLVTPLSIGNSSVCFRQVGMASPDDPVVVGSSNRQMKSEARQSAFNKNFGTTPGSVMEGNEVAAFLQFLMSQEVTSGSSSFSPGVEYGIIPDNGYYYTGRAASYTARLYAYVKADSGVTGEAALYDVAAGAVVTGSTISFTSNSYALLQSADFTLLPGKVYTYALRRVAGGLLTNARIRSAMITIKLPKA